MGEKTKRIKLPERDALIKRLVNTGYAFAIWRLPNETYNHFIISIEGAQQIDELNFQGLHPGFLINKFQDAHPLAPYYIRADISIDKDEITFSPTLHDRQLDQFHTSILKDDNDLDSTTATTESAPDTSNFSKLVEQAIEQINQGYFEKIVLSRKVDLEVPGDLSIWDYYKKLTDKYASAFCSLSHIPGQGIWIGASPELLISDNKDRFMTVSLAGTKKILLEQSLTEIAWTQKEIEEQALVSRYIINCFKKIRLREFYEQGPKTTRAGSLAHLKTIFEVKHSEVPFDDLAEQMLELLHPTSAVCGMPIELASNWIDEHEGYDREFYSGFLGPVNMQDATQLFVNLRCAKIMNGMIRLYAGAGITQDSVPDKEHKETDLKMDILRTLLE